MKFQKLIIIILLSLSTNIGVAQIDTKQLDFLKRDSVFNDIYKNKELLNDIIVLYFTKDNEQNIKSQIPKEAKFACVNLGMSKSYNCYDEYSLFMSLSIEAGLENAKIIFPIYLFNSSKTSYLELDKKRKKELEEFIILRNNCIITGDTLKTDTHDYIFFVKIDTIPEQVKNVLPNTEFYYEYYETWSSSYKYLVIYFNEKVYSSNTFNEIYFLENPDTTCSIEERIICFLYLTYGFESNIEILKIENITTTFEKFNKTISFNYKITLNENGIPQICYMFFNYNQIYYYAGYVENQEIRPFFVNAYKYSDEAIISINPYK